MKHKKLVAILMACVVAILPATTVSQAEVYVSSDMSSATVVRESDDTEAQIEEIKEELLTISSEIEELTAEKVACTEAMEERIAYLYVNGSGGGVLSAILGAESFADMLNNIAVQQKLYEYDSQQLEELESLIEELEEKQEALNEDLGYYQEILEEQETEDVGLNLVEEALKYIGVPYVWGGSSPSGLDCSGLIYYCVNNCGNGWSMPRVNAESIRASYCTEISKDELQPGDLLFFQGTYSTSGASHVAIYIGEGMMVHAAGSAVHISSIDESYWVRHLLQYGRLNL